MEPVRLGIIGCGVIGRHHVAAALAADEVELLAVADLIAERAEEQAARGAGIAVYGEGHELLADARIEAVVLAMPAADRFQLGLDAFAAGKHLLTEKPVARSLAEIDALMGARGPLVGAGCSCRYRFMDSARAATEFMAGDPLGPLQVVRCRAIVPAGGQPSLPRPTWRLSHALNGGGILANWGVYDLDYLFGILGWRLRPERVLAGCWPVPPAFDHYAAPGSDAETHVAFTALCAGGTMLQYERAEFIAAEGDAAWEILGRDGALRLVMKSGTKELVHTSGVPGEGARHELLWSGSDDDGPVHHGPIPDFCRAIRTGTPPMTTLEQSRVIQALTDAVYESSRRGEAVRVSGKGVEPVQ